MITDAAGVPLAGHVTAANVNDVTHALPLLVDLPRVGGARGAPRWRPDELLADKGYDCQPLRELVAWLGIKPRMARRKQPTAGLGRQRWPVERTLSWLHQFRRLRTRYDRLESVHQAFLDLAMSLICLRRLQQRFC